MSEPNDVAKKKALDLAISHIEKQFGEGAIMSLGDHRISRTIQTISTGAISLDLALGIGKAWGTYLKKTIIRPNKPVVSYQREGMIGLDDPLFNFKYTLRFMKILGVGSVTFPSVLPIPVLLGVGENDELFSVDAARSLFEEIPSKNKNFVVLPGAKHAVFPEGAFKELTDWLTSNFKVKQEGE